MKDFAHAIPDVEICRHCSNGRLNVYVCILMTRVSVVCCKLVPTLIPGIGFCIHVNIDVGFIFGKKKKKN